MFSRPAVVVFGVAIVEFFVFVFLAQTFGALLTSLVAVLLTVCGIYYLARFAPRVVSQGLKQFIDSGGEISTREAGDQAGRIAAGLLLAVPGILTGACGLLLLIKPVRKLLSPVFGMKVLRLLPSVPLQVVGSLRRHGRGDVIDVEGAEADSHSRSPKARGPKLPNPPH